MDELNEEIKLTIHTMQTDIDDGAHGELQSHLYSLLEMKRNELQQRLVERSWSESALGDDKAIPLLTTEELEAGGWWCDDISEECRVAFVSAGVSVAKSSWGDGNFAGYAYKLCDSEYVRRAFHDVDPERFYQIHRIGNEFYWGEK